MKEKKELLNEELEEVTGGYDTQEAWRLRKDGMNAFCPEYSEQDAQLSSYPVRPRME